MTRTFASAVVLGLVGGLFASPVPRAGERVKPDPGEFVRRAIADGLAEDGVPPAFAASIAKHDDFLGKCPICGPSHRAFEEYGRRTDAPKAKSDRGLTEEFVQRLGSAKDDVRRAALRELVQRYVELAYAKSDLSDEQKKALQKELEKMRGTPALPGGQKFCPSCDGACRLVPRG